MSKKPEKPKETERADGSVISSGVSGRSGTLQDSGGEVISSGVSGGPSSGERMVSAGVSVMAGTELVLNGNTYKVVELIAQSSGEAEVYLVEREGEKYALKHYYPNFRPHKGILERMKGIHHDDVVDLIDYGYHGDRFCEILEYAAGGSLVESDEDGGYRYLPIKDRGRLRQIVQEFIYALDFCHSKGVVHRDIKPENTFFKNENGTDIIIGDFGISTALDEGKSRRMSGVARTESYAAPEIYDVEPEEDGTFKTQVSKAVDYYSFGITLLHIWTGEDPFSGASDLGIMKLKEKGKVPVPEDMPEELKTLIKGLITVDPPGRWGCDEVQKWLRGEKVALHYTTVEHEYKPFGFDVLKGGKELLVEDPADLPDLFSKHPYTARKHIYRGRIQDWLKDAGDPLYVALERIVEEEYPQEKEAGLTKAVYVLDPSRKYTTEGGVECGGLEEIGDAIEREASHYRSYLIDTKNPDLFLYLESRELEEVAEKCREYVRQLNPDRAFSSILLELQGREKLKFGSLLFYKPEDILGADDEVKNELAAQLSKPDSKLSVWLEQFFEFKGSQRVETWRQLKRHNSVTLSYALEEGSPFHLGSEKVYSLDEFRRLWGKAVSGKRYQKKLLRSAKSFIEEADFWLRWYHDSSYREIVDGYFRENHSGMERSLFALFTLYLMDELEPDYYWDNIKLLVDSGYERGVVSRDLISKQEGFLRGKRREMEEKVTRFVEEAERSIEIGSYAEVLGGYEETGDYVKNHPDAQEVRDRAEKLMREHFISEAKSAFQTRNFPVVLKRYKEVKPYIGQDEDVQKVKDRAENLRKKYQAEWKAYEKKAKRVDKSSNQYTVNWLNYHKRPLQGEKSLLQLENDNEAAIQILLKMKQKYSWDEKIEVRLTEQENIKRDVERMWKDIRFQRREVIASIISGAIIGGGICFLVSLSFSTPLGIGLIVVGIGGVIGAIVCIIKNGFWLETKFYPVSQRRREAEVKDNSKESSRQEEPEPGAEKVLKLPGGVELLMRFCPPTTSGAWKARSEGEDFFLMGSPKDKLGRKDDEEQHKIKLTKGFWIGKYPVTQRQWKAVAGDNPSEFKESGSDAPVEMVSWDDVQEWLKKVRRDAGCEGLRLPTEAEWEYACRAGTRSSLNSGKEIACEDGFCPNLDEIACYGENSGENTHPVGQKKPNAWGLYDMHGNVREWCADWYGDYPSGTVTDPTGPRTGVSRVLRGGSWINNPWYCRSAYRYRLTPDDRFNDIGFRLVLDFL